LLLLTTSQHVQAEGDGNWLLDNCQAAIVIFDKFTTPGSPPDPVTAAKMTTCVYYIKGVTDSAILWTGGKEPYCITNVPNSQLVRVVAKGLSDNPESLHEPAVTLVTKILAKSFPWKEALCGARRK
jgi:hypothetical protein